MASLYSIFSDEVRGVLEAPEKRFSDESERNVFKGFRSKSRDFFPGKHAKFTTEELKKMEKIILTGRAYDLAGICDKWESLSLWICFEDDPALRKTFFRGSGENGGGGGGRAEVKKIATGFSSSPALPSFSSLSLQDSALSPPVLAPVGKIKFTLLDDAVSSLHGVKSDGAPVSQTTDSKKADDGGMRSSFPFHASSDFLGRNVQAFVKLASDSLHSVQENGIGFSAPTILCVLGGVCVLCLFMAALYSFLLVLTFTIERLHAMVSVAVSLATTETALQLPAVEKSYRSLVLYQPLVLPRNSLKLEQENAPALSLAKMRAGFALGGKTGAYTALSWEKLTEIRMHALEIKVNSTEEKLASLQVDVFDRRFEQNAFFLNMSGRLDNLTCSIHDRVNALELGLRAVQTSDLAMVNGKVVQVLDVTQTPEYKRLHGMHTESLDEIKKLKARLEVLENKTCAAPEEVKTLQDSLAAIQKQVNTLTHPEWDLQQIRLTAKYQVQVMVVYTVLGSATLILSTIQAVNWAQSFDFPVSVGGIMSMIWRFVTYDPVI